MWLDEARKDRPLRRRRRHALIQYSLTIATVLLLMANIRPSDQLKAQDSARTADSAAFHKMAQEEKNYRPGEVVRGLDTLLAVLGDTVSTDQATVLLQQCQTAVSRQLKRPGAARFTGNGSAEKGDQVIYVSGTIEGENRFGGRIRSSYICKMVPARRGFAVEEAGVKDEL